MATYKRFEELPIWQEARCLYKEIDAITRRPVLSHEFRFCSQIKSAAGSVMDNIAEGFERDSNLEFINHLSYSKGSIGEVRSQSYRALDESFITEEEQIALNNRYIGLASDIANLIKYLNNCEIRGLKFAGRNGKTGSNKSSPNLSQQFYDNQKSEIPNQKSQ